MSKKTHTKYPQNITQNILLYSCSLFPNLQCHFPERAQLKVLHIQIPNMPSFSKEYIIPQLTKWNLVESLIPPLKKVSLEIFQPIGDMKGHCKQRSRVGSEDNVQLFSSYKPSLCLFNHRILNIPSLRGRA